MAWYCASCGQYNFDGSKCKSCGVTVKCSGSNHRICGGRIKPVSGERADRTVAYSNYICTKCKGTQSGVKESIRLEGSYTKIVPKTHCTYTICGTCKKRWFPSGPCKCAH